jgi:hypothetical protein
MAVGERERTSRWGRASLPLHLDEYCDPCRLTFFVCEVNRPGEQATVRSRDRARRTKVASST